MLIPKNPVRVALIGAGNRSNNIYKPLFKGLKPWIELVAVCDPVKEHADSLAECLNAKAFYDIHDLVKEADIEAAIVVTPIALHHPYSIFLSEHKIHNLVETTWCATLSQARQMVDCARKNGVYTRVAENFFRYPIDRFAQTLRDNGYIGDIKRIFSYNDHTGYHSNSRWLVFAGEHPEWISAITHSMPTIPFCESAERFHDSELFRARFIQFPSGLMVIDQAANIKGMTGRQVRPGFNEWHGTRGTLVQQGARYAAPTHWIHDNNGRVERGSGVHSDWTAEIRCCDYEDTRVLTNEIRPANPNQISKVERFYKTNGCWAGVKACIPGGEIRYENPIITDSYGDHYYHEYGIAVMGHIIDFALQIRGLADSEFNEEDAMMSLMMEMAARESVLQNGTRIKLPLEGELEADKIALDDIRKRFGVDPLDIEGMMAYKYPKP